MRLWPSLLSHGLLMSSLSFVAGSRFIQSTTLDVLQPGNLSVSHFEVLFDPDDQRATFNLVGNSSIKGYVTADVILVIYGYETSPHRVDPCKISGMEGFCPMNSGPLSLPSANVPIPEDAIGDIPGIGFTVPDLDASIRIEVHSAETGAQITAVEAILTNGKSVYQLGIGWATAVVAGLALVVCTVLSIREAYPIAVARLTAYTLALFHVMQSQAMIGMLAVPMPPIVRAWAQNFQWSMGVVHAGFLETICTWYLRSTGGTADDIQSVLETGMVDVLKKRAFSGIVDNAGHVFTKRAETTVASTPVIVRGLSRVAFSAGIEATNLFLTSIIIFGFVTVVVMLLVALWKAAGLIVRHGRHPLGQHQYWHPIAKGILYRLVLVGFAPLCIFCLWEFTQHDSAAELVVAAVMLVSVLGVLTGAALRVVLAMRQSLQMNQDPRYILFSNNAYLHKYGFLFIPYNAKSLFFITVTLAYLLVKSLFIGLAQSSPTTQTIAFFVIETAMLLAVSILRPWMDKITNGYNITIAAINFLNSIFILFFSGIFGQPKIVASVMGVLLFVINAILILLLLLLVIVSSVQTLFFRKPDSHYKEKQSPFTSQGLSATQLVNSGLDELSATARGEGKRDSAS